MHRRLGVGLRSLQVGRMRGCLLASPRRTAVASAGSAPAAGFLRCHRSWPPAFDLMSEEASRSLLVHARNPAFWKVGKCPTRRTSDAPVDGDAGPTAERRAPSVGEASKSSLCQVISRQAHSLSGWLPALWVTTGTTFRFGVYIHSTFYLYMTSAKQRLPVPEATHRDDPRINSQSNRGRQYFVV